MILRFGPAVRRLLCTLTLTLAITWLAFTAAAMTIAYLTNLDMPLQGVMDGE